MILVIFTGKRGMMSRIPETPFGLSSEEVFRHSYTENKRRKKKKVPRKFSDRLSAEGQLAMQLARGDSLLGFRDNNEACDNLISTSYCDVDSVTTSSDQKRRSYCDGSTGSQPPAPVAPSVCPSSRLTDKSCYSFSEIYARSASARMMRDITDEKFRWDKQARKPLRGGKLEGTLEMVEVVNADEPSVNWNQDAIQEMAKVTAIDKCKVWMEANRGYEFSEFDGLNDDLGEPWNDGMDTN